MARQLSLGTALFISGTKSVRGAGITGLGRYISAAISVLCSNLACLHLAAPRSSGGEWFIRLSHFLPFPVKTWVCCLQTHQVWHEHSELLPVIHPLTSRYSQHLNARVSEYSQHIWLLTYLPFHCFQSSAVICVKVGSSNAPKSFCRGVSVVVVCFMVF